MTLDHAPDPLMIAVVGGDDAVGRALEVLLRSADHSVRYLDHRSVDEHGLLETTRLLLLAPGLDNKRREALLTSIESKPLAKRIPVLELVRSDQQVRDGVKQVLPWPCLAEELKRHVEIALSAGFSAQASTGMTRDQRDQNLDRGVRIMGTTVVISDLTIVAVEDQVSSKLGGEVAILDLKAGVYYGLNAVGARIWQLLQTPRSVHEIRDILLEEYGVEPDRCEQDLLALLHELASERLIKVIDEGH